MGNKRQSFFQLNWTASIPAPFVPNTPVSGVTVGAMASTNTIYSNIQDITFLDNVGLEVTYTGTPTGTIQILGSISGVNFYPITFSPALTQPGGSAGGYLINLNQWPWKYIFVQYTNSSGTGSLGVWINSKDIN